MGEEVQAFGTELAKAALARNWRDVHSLLAPWLRRTLSIDDVRRFFEDEYLRTLVDNGVTELQYPEHPEPDVGGNTFVNATSLREPMSFAGGKVRDVAPELTDENMKYWLRLQLQCSDAQMAALGFDYFCEVWAAVVETPEGLRVGYWSQGAY